MSRPNDSLGGKRKNDRGHKWAPKQIHIDSTRGNKLEEKLHGITNKTLLEMSADTVLFFQGTQSLAAVQIKKKKKKCAEEKQRTLSWYVLRNRHRDLRQQRWDCPALHLVQNLCWTHYLLSERKVLLPVHWGESRSPHVRLPPFFLFLSLLDPWSLLHAPASSFAQAALPTKKKKDKNSLSTRNTCSALRPNFSS